VFGALQSNQIAVPGLARVPNAQSRETACQHLKHVASACHPASSPEPALPRRLASLPGQRIFTYRYRAWGQPQPTADVSRRRHDALRPPAMALGARPDRDLGSCALLAGCRCCLAAVGLVTTRDLQPILTMPSCRVCVVDPRHGRPEALGAALSCQSGSAALSGPSLAAWDVALPNLPGTAEDCRRARLAVPTRPERPGVLAATE
jgi:hypothetical protein